MKKLLLIVGIIIIIACIVFFALALLNMYGYHHVLDGAPSLYDRLHRKMITYYITSAVCAASGALCIIIHTKI